MDREIKDRIQIYKIGKWMILLSIFFVLLSSCSNDALSSGTDSDETVTVHMTFKASSQTVTRALSSNESTINDITVLIFNSNGDEIGSNYKTFTSSDSSPYSVDVATRLATNCAVYAIANAGSSGYFAGVSTLAAFKAKYTTLTAASDLGDASSALMFGKNTDTVNITTASQSIGAISLARLCTKLNFTITPASGITITGYQLCHAPLSSYITDATSTSSYNPGGTYGDMTAVTGLTTASTAVSANYYMYENLAGTSSSSTTEALRTSVNAPTNATYLLVYAKTSGWSSVYRIYLGGTSSTDYTNYNIPRNYNYNYNIAINGSGWTDTRVIYTTNAPADAVYYYSDGTYGSYDPTKMAIGIVFSTTTSTTDQANGWTHGYAMALTNAQSEGGLTWASSDYQSTQEFTTEINTVALMESDMDGYSHCQTMKSKSMYSQTNYPPFYYALNYGTASIGGTKYAAPSSTSGWYLPSQGQWYMIIKNLGGITRAIDDTLSHGDGSLYGCWNNTSFTAAAAINTYLNPVDGETIDCSSSEYRWFWSSSEWDASHACNMGFSSYGTLNLDVADKWNSGGTDNRVRAVLAF